MLLGEREKSAAYVHTISCNSHSEIEIGFPDSRKEMEKGL